MSKYAVAVVMAVILTGCSSLDFYAPEVGPQWTSGPVKVVSSGASVDGLSVRLVAEDYSDVVSVGNLLAPAYKGARRENWAVEGPSGLRATIEVIQSDLIFAGPVTKNFLSADSIDYAKGRQAVRLTSASDSQVSERAPVSTPPVIKVGVYQVTPTYQGKSGGKVSDYKSWGLATGLRLEKGGELQGYLSLTNGTVLRKAPQVAQDPLLTALALVAAQPHFVGKTPVQKVVPEVFEVFGLTFTSEITHN